MIETRNPTMVASCGCPYDPEYDAGHVGWHLAENHRDVAASGLFTWRSRLPTREECALVGRDVEYASTTVPPEWRGHVAFGDYVIETHNVPEAQAKLAEALESFGMCDSAHVIPTGVYLEE